jgi:hypothetical protein
MAFGIILERFIDAKPIPIMARALLERMLNAERLNACFERSTQKQYTRNLLFSSVFELMTQVVFKVFPSIKTTQEQALT